jgi:adenosine kinase
MASQHEADGLLLGAGNPLLDISAHVTPAVFEKYGLKGGNAILAEEKHMPIYAELEKDYAEGIEFIAGGATQNSIRAAQWMLGGKRDDLQCGYIGGIGDDAYAEKLRAAAQEAGIKTFYHVDKSTPTGRCAVCVQDKERSLVADLAAANNYSKDHFDSAEVQKAVEKAKFFYSSGFFSTASPETLLAIGAHCAEHDDKRFLLNLAAPFLMEVPPLWANMKKAIEFADVVFCNEDEAATLGKVCHWGDDGKDLMEVARQLQKSEKANTSNPRIVIFTQGKDPTIVCQGQEEGDTVRHDVPKIDGSKIVDTNGAGDSFVGGFLSRYIVGRSLADAVQAGHYCAGECIQRSGCTYPEKNEYKD